jgi:hypothetical protein
MQKLYGIIIISIIICILCIFQKYKQSINTYYNFKYLETLMNPQNEFISLYNLCQKYSTLENLLIETSLKISEKSINYQRWTIPILFGNFLENKNINTLKLKSFCDELSQLIFKDQNGLSDRFYDYITLTIDPVFDSDLIVGYDWKNKIFKVYINNPNSNLECLEFYLKTSTINRKHYKITNFHHKMNTKSLKLLERLEMTPKTYRIIYEQTSELVNNGDSVVNNGDSVVHIVLKYPTSLNRNKISIVSEYFRQRLSPCLEFGKVSVIALKIGKNGDILSLSFYMRPTHCLTWINQFYSYFNIIY